jgi:hypothetical protein
MSDRTWPTKCSGCRCDLEAGQWHNVYADYGLIALCDVCFDVDRLGLEIAQCDLCSRWCEKALVDLPEVSGKRQRICRTHSDLVGSRAAHASTK